MTTSERDWFCFVLGGLCETLVEKITNGVVTDGVDISMEFATRIGHLAQVDTIRAIRNAEGSVDAVIHDAVSKYTSGLRNMLLTAKSRPVALSPNEILIGTRRVYTKRGSDQALAFYDLTHPFTDFVNSILPIVPPALNSESAVYEFIGTRLNDVLIASRARLLKRAAETLKC